MAIGTLPDTDVNTRVPRRKNLGLFLEIWTTQVCHHMYKMDDQTDRSGRDDRIDTVRKYALVLFKLSTA